MNNVLVIGDFIIDHYIEGFITRQSPEDVLIPIIDIEKEYYKCGGAGNVAIKIKSLNKELNIDLCCLYNSVCSDELSQKNIGTKGFDIPLKNSIVKTRIVNVSTKKQIIRIDRNKKFGDVNFLNLYILASLDSFKKYDYIVVSDYCKGIISNFTISVLNNFNGTVFVDTKQKDISVWNNIKNCIIKINHKEWLESSQNSEHPVIVTLGEDGAELHNSKDYKDVVEFSQKNKVKNANVIGCGDIFLSGLVVKYIETNDIYKSIDFANEVASESAKKQIGE